MANSTEVLNLFTDRVKQLIMSFENVKKENDELRIALEDRKRELAQTKTQLEQTVRSYDNLKTARMLEISDGDVDGAKKRITGLIREINSCITMLSEKQ